MSDRVAVFMQDLKGGGAERVMVNLALGLADRGLQVDMVLVRNEGDHLPSLGDRIRIVTLGTRRTIRSITALAGYLRRERPVAIVSALVHVNIAAILAARLARVGTRVVVTEHSNVSNDRANEPRPLVSLAFAAMPLLYRLADRIVAVSSGVADSLARAARVRRDRVDVIYNPVVSPKLIQLAAEQVEHPWLSPDAPPVILAVGRLTDAKDFPTLLRAFAALRARRAARLVILGEGERRPELETLVQSLGIVDDVWLPGFVRNPYAWMARARVLALSSRWEGLPTVLVEAMACGTPVVATDCPSGPAEILSNGRYGRLVPTGDHERLATALDAAIGETPPRAALRERADAFSVATAAADYAALLVDRPAPARRTA